ncbi:MAG TPA: L,D-transpeptidase [Candidatus Dormibacteraeota bacterium]|nr:L,D-transpeptidase [Candidatus Dormibacteraeota bacterium]
MAVIVTVAVVVVAALGTGGYVLSGRAGRSRAAEVSARERLAQDVRQAPKLGYQPADLGSALVQARRFLRTAPPFWARSVAGLPYYEHRTSQGRTLDARLLRRERAVLSELDSRLSGRAKQAQSAYAHDQQIQTPTPVLAPYTSQLSALQTSVEAQAKTPSPTQLYHLNATASTLVSELKQVGVQQAKVNTTIQAAATTLMSQSGGNVQTLRGDGNGSIASGNNDASIATYESLAGRFPKIPQMDSLYNTMAFYEPGLNAAAADQVAFAAAAIGQYASQINALLLANLGPEHIIVNYQQQEIYYYQNGQLVQHSLVTTGIRGVTSVGTDFGPMQVLSKDSPWTFTSPWPKGSPYYYPPTPVSFAVFFTDTGEAIHDAPWESDSELGPGSQFDAATESHGCVHVPLNIAQFTFQWANIGTPVDVYPGNGESVAQQLSLMTTNNQGVPQGGGIPIGQPVPEG